MITEINKDNFEKEVLRSEKPLLPIFGHRGAVTAAGWLPRSTAWNRNTAIS